MASFFKSKEKKSELNLGLGDVVKVEDDLDSVKSRQKGHGDWDMSMARVLGMVGKVKEFYNNGDVKVEFNNGGVQASYRFNRSNVAKIDLSRGDRVQISTNIELVITAQKGRPHWNIVEKSLGQRGTFEAFYQDGDVKVIMDNNSVALILNPKILTKLPPGINTDSNSSNGSNGSSPTPPPMPTPPTPATPHLAQQGRPGLPQRIFGTITLRNRKAPAQAVKQDYEVMEELGRGAFGVVRKCKDVKTGEFFVLKETIQGGKAAMAVAENEVDRLKELTHQRVVRYFGSDQQAGKLLIKMEYLTGGSLLSHMKKKLKRPLKEAEALAFTLHTLEGLAYIHAKGIVHMDVKCDNLLLSQDAKTLKVGDFGIAVKLQLDTVGQTFFKTGDNKCGGTFYFMAPEVLSGQKWGRSSDIWSLGCTIVEMLIGYPPHAEKLNGLQYIGARLRNELKFDAKELAPKASVLLQQFLVNLFNIDANQRFHDAGGALKEFQRLFKMSDKPLPSPPVPAPAPFEDSGKYVPRSYNVEKELGKGGFGVVSLCRDTDTFRFFVVKETIVSTPDGMVVAQNEIDKLKNLSHPRIVEYFGSTKKDGKIIIFMEFLSGGSVKDNIKKFAPMGLTETQTVTFTRQTLEGLAFIHNKNIIHSDIKCDNLLLDLNGEVKLGDFGIAMESVINSYCSAANGQAGGTLYFMAPEIFANSQNFGRSADIWSLGCTMIEMLTGRPPYSHLNTFEYMKARTASVGQLTFDANTLVPKASAPMKQFLAHLLKISRKDRYQNADSAMSNFVGFFPKS